IWSVCVLATGEPNIGLVITRAANHRKVLAKVSAGLIVANRVNKTVLWNILKDAFFWKEGEATGRGAGCLPAKCGVFVKTKTAVETTKHVVSVDEAVISRQQSY